MSLRSLSRVVGLRTLFLQGAPTPPKGAHPFPFVRNLRSSQVTFNVSPNPNEEKESSSSGNKASEGQGSEPDKKLKEELDKMVTENKSLQEKTKELEDKYLRALAETENVRNRLTKQIQDAKLFAIQGFCKDLTEIEEILRMAIDSVPKEEATEGNKHLKNLYEGLTMTSARLVQVFKKHGLTTINPIDTKFNPNEHEAVVVQQVEGKESGTVVFVSKLGYKLHDRVIKPAIVGVAK